MKSILIFLVIMFFMLFAKGSFGQDCSEYKIHLQSIDSTYHPGHILDRRDTVFNANRAFVDYTIAHLLANPADSCFIANRNVLRKLKTRTCDSTLITIIDTLQHGELCKITLSIGSFEAAKHQMRTNEDSSRIKEINGQFPFGGQYGIPEIEIKEVRIEIDGVNLIIPKEAYSNFYEPILCDNMGFARQVEVYESLNGQFIYLYMYGGNASDTYFAKLIFDKTQYVSHIVSDYYPLSIHGAFREDFIGF